MDGSSHRAEAGDLPGDGRVRTVVVGGRSVALARCGARLGALANRCPHQGGPLGEGSIENGWLRWPWHGYDYDPGWGGPENDFTNHNTTFMTWNLLHLARMLKDAGCRLDFANPEYR